MAEELPKRKMPEFKIGKEYMDNLKTVAAVTDVLSKDEELVKQIAEIFKEVAMEKERELINRVTELIAEKVTTVPADKIKASFDYWYVLSPAGISPSWVPTGWRQVPWQPVPSWLWVPR